MSLIPLLFQFPTISNVYCLFPLRSREGETNDPYAGGNLSFEVGDDEERVLLRRRELKARMAPLGLRALCDARQVHGDTLLFAPEELVREEDRPIARECDGMATQKNGLGLFIKTADCQPVLVTDKNATAIMAIHVGWRGNRARFIQKAVALFTETYSLRPEDLLAVRGPSLGTGNAQFVNAKDEWPSSFSPWFNEQEKTMDLWGLTRSQLLEAGLPERSVFGIDICTMRNGSCYSYRRDKVCGRLGGIIWKQ
ncbi:MAG: polyphenol oxidase family protein [Desulfovibrio sp.]|nr:polyphenol oxidase family protein [Desulfovibrio sp.]